MKEPLKPNDARLLIRKILEKGVFRISGHAYKRMDERYLTELDVINVLRGAS